MTTDARATRYKKLSYDERVEKRFASREDFVSRDEVAARETNFSDALVFVFDESRLGG
jgi:hypothetical protein